MTLMQTFTISAVALVALAGPSWAQDTVQSTTATDLPPITVEGATIEAKPAIKPKPKAKPAPVVAEEVEEAPAQPVKKKKNAASLPSSPKKAAASAPPVEVFPEADASSADTAPTNSDATVSNGLATEKVGSAVTIVTGVQLKAQQVRNAADAIRQLPGVSVSRTGGFNGLTQIRLRGAEGNHTLVLIDGVEANDTFNGEFDFSDLSADDIERIEVLRGPQSGLYGSGAIGGVINIVTRGGRGPLTFRCYGEGGSFNTKAGQISVSGGTDKLWGSLSVSGRRTDGFNIAPEGGERDGSELKTFNIRAGAQVMPGVALDLSLRRTSKEGERDTQAPFPDPSGVQVDDPATFEDQSLLGAARLTWESFDGRFVQSAKIARSETERSDVSAFFGTPNTVDNSGVRENYSYTATYRLDTPGAFDAKHFFTAFAEHENEAFRPRSDFGFGFAADGIERSRGLDAVAGEYRGEFANMLFLQGTVRHDDSDIFGSFNTWRTSASLVVPGTGLRPHASYGTGVKLPTMFETFGSIPGSYYPNPLLGPEESKGWDAGLELALFNRAAIIDVTYFDNEITGKIRNFANCRPAPPPFFNECTAVNAPGVSAQDGVEVAGHLNLGSGLSLGLAYTFIDARDPAGVEEIRRPRHGGRADFNYAFDQGRGLFAISAQYTGDVPDTNFATFSRVTLEPYWLVNVAASYKVAPGVELFGRVENLLDEDYQEVFGFETAGVAAYAGVRLTYEEPSTLSWAEYK